jgi:RimJ/RimL family protein N-acetyltransferase
MFRPNADKVKTDQPMRSHVREMQLDETRSMIRYFLEADHGFLNGMGVDPKKLPSESTWFELLQEDFARPIQQRQFYFLAWVVDGAPIGHCNINKIAFGQSAFMHLHVWNAAHRRGGCASQLLKPSVVHFFERFELRELFCEPYALNPAPNQALPKVGYRLVKSYETTPGWINFHQPVNLWVLDRETALKG